MATIDKRAVRLSRLVVALLVATLLGYWPLLPASFPPQLDWLTLVVSVHLALLVAAIVGLLRSRSWGFYCLYMLVPTSTVLLSISFVPYLPRLFATDLRPLVLTLVNLAFLGLGAMAHVAHRKSVRAS